MRLIDLQKANKERNQESFAKREKSTYEDWGHELVDETASVVVLIEKFMNEQAYPGDVGRGLADVILCAASIADKFGIRLGHVISRRFNEISNQEDSEIMLTPMGQLEYELLCAEMTIDRHKGFIESEGLQAEFEEYEEVMNTVPV